MDQLKNLEAWNALFVLTQTGSLSAAAAQLDTEVSTVSRLIAGLEKALGRSLLHRERKPASPTDDAMAAAQAIRPVLTAHAAVVSKLLDEQSALKGTIRLAVAGGLLHDKLMPLLLEFRELYPDIDFDISAGRKIEECLRGEIDVASISGKAQQKGLVSLPRGRSIFIPVASPEYLAKNGVPLTPEDLVRHTGLVYTGPVRESTSKLMKGDQSRELTFGSRIQSTDILMIKKAALDGVGIAVDLPLLHCAEALAEGKLQVILDGWHRPPIAAYAVCSTSAWHQKRVRLFIRWWCERFEREFARTEQIARAVLGNDASHYFDD